MRNITPANVDIKTKNLLILSNDSGTYIVPLMEVTLIGLRSANTLHIVVETRRDNYIVSGEEKELQELFERLRDLISGFFSQGA